MSDTPIYDRISAEHGFSPETESVTEEPAEVSASPEPETSEYVPDFSDSAQENEHFEVIDQ